MKNNKSTIALIVLITLSIAMIAFVGCSKNNDSGGFEYSKGIDKNGFWSDFKALDHVVLCEYEGIIIPANIHEITEQRVESEIAAILENHAIETQIMDRAVEDGDTVNIDYVGSVDGVEFEGGNTMGNGTDVTIGVTQYIDDFLEQIIGKSPGETFDVEVTFPENYGKDELNGKDAIFKTTVNYIVDTINPELNDEFVMQNLAPYYGYETVDEMKTGIYNTLRDSSIELYLQEYLIDNSTVENLPESLVSYQENTLILYYKDIADYYQVDFNDFIASSVGVSTTEELLTLYREDNVKTSKFYIVLQAIAEEVKISVSDEDLTLYFVEHMGSPDYSQYEDVYKKPHLKLVALHQAVMNYVSEKVVLE